MSLVLALLLSLLAVVYTVVVWIGNKGSFHNYIDPGADIWLIGAWVVVMLAWLSRLWW